ncbi:hypothetical protein KEM60_00711 [Austwickia sp. TVS 96-490-7B]|uniref:T3SS (YopN, CesT) and YbjN peptide-binding chaperone 1 n=1 Tax=Austwickia sp. TVS 96-490-7B TaxID=2830843 RepID=UPI001C5775C6|nr:hypothetical protein [Austwickia sp. TVS 96-490-7B]MBW3084523.1 hypothetical protein [Austwickia sp. TVS 96-490-7B]
MSDPTSLPNFPPPADEHPLRGRVLDALQDEGFRPDIDSDGDIAFKVNGQQLFVHCFEGDVPLLRVFGQWQIDEALPKDELVRLQRCNELTLRLNVVKVGLNNETLFVTAEQICMPDSDPKMISTLLTQLVLQAVQVWHELMLGRDPFGEGQA